MGPLLSLYTGCLPVTVAAAPAISFALIADPHLQGGDRRHLPALIDHLLNQQLTLDFIVCLGDAIYGLPEDEALRDAEAAWLELQRLPCPSYMVLGNHDLMPFIHYEQAPLSALLSCWQMPGPWYDFTCQGWQGLVLNTWLQLPDDELEDQLEWLEAQMAAATGPVIVFSHEAIGFQPGDWPIWLATNNTTFWPPGNGFERLLSAANEQVTGVFAGHKHCSLNLCRGGVNYHLVAAAHHHGGQAALVTMTATGHCTVTALGPLAPEPHRPAATRQQSYTLPPGC